MNFKRSRLIRSYPRNVGTALSEVFGLKLFGAFSPPQRHLQRIAGQLRRHA